ncbi:isopentenyl-diphosphate Delta-isomerase [Sphingobacterium sp. CZ-2]|uniref:isopentenyl-diphosphate Delta-isomerase n=1 Tax=Sphingobacterium sp. CZ-2 TaxID=2557994 RepID=UPI00106F5A6F|nr:isopentenyl-diphosphate Delta-isomerase [Sphingobacterium sp. CZ-2]QBR13259.1 isopentenyl-diphosphate Delta-isomerase [Sphingobacterium sp. CZ-2]
MRKNQEIKNRDLVVLVNEQDEEMGLMEKMEAHQLGLLHRAFSVFIFNKEGKILIQRRAAKKYHGALLWTNTCCSHQQLDETTMQAAKERLMAEMGLACPLFEVYKFQYKEYVENNLIEHELDTVLVGYSDVDPDINPLEVADYQWISLMELLQWMQREPESFTIWFKIILPKLLTTFSNISPN